MNTISCLSVGSAGSGTVTFAWNNGRTSTFCFNQSVSHPVGQTVTTYTGNITAGEFAGDSAVAIFTGVSPDLIACLTRPGVTSDFALSTLAITSL